ncbi:hypothetical protein OROMI_002833 [Orobanche minor]
MELPTNCKGEASRSKRSAPKYHGMSDMWGCTLPKRVKGFLLSAWTNFPGVATYAAATLEFVYIYDSTTAVHFLKCCRTYNNTTAFSSLGITYDRTLAQSNKGIYTLRIQGAVYHFIRGLIPPGGPGRQLQLYFFDTENELDNRLSQSGGLDLKILEDIVEMMKSNPYAIFFRSLRELTNLQDYNIVLRADPCLDMRIYNLPTTHQVAAIWNKLTYIPAYHPHDIRVCTSAGKTHRVHYYYGCYDPLQYPLLFPYGESGWHKGIEKLAPVSNHYQGQQYNICDGQNVISLDGEHCGESILGNELQSSLTSLFSACGAALVTITGLLLYY